MKNQKSRESAKTFVGFLLIVILYAHSAIALVGFPTTSLTIHTTAGSARFTVEIASSAEQLDQGLMYRQKLAPDAGMLFDLGQAQPISMWMKNTLIPLDMVFVDAVGKIVDIHTDARPQSIELITSHQPCRYVVELNAGTVARFKIERGDSMSFGGLTSGTGR